MSRDSRRERPTRPIGPRVIIACEGQTEQFYFDDIRQTRKLAHQRVRVLNRPGTDPLNIVKAAIADRDAIRRSSGWTAEDSAWAIFDGEEHFRNNPHNWNDAIQIAGSQSIKLAISNPCIELWYLLHFQGRSAALNARTARELLRGHIPGFSRSSRIYHSHLYHRTEGAIARAQQLAVWHLPSPSSLPPNPSTGVADLVTLLISLKSSR